MQVLQMSVHAMGVHSYKWFDLIMDLNDLKTLVVYISEFKSMKTSFLVQKHQLFKLKKEKKRTKD